MTMFTRSLFKHFLSFSLFALLLLPQISEPSSALAKRPTATPTPKPVMHVKKSVAKPVIKTVPNTCLSVALSTAFSDGPIAVANPPGEAITFAVALNLANNCGTTVTSGATIEATVNTTCVDPTSTPNIEPPVSHSFPDPIVNQTSANVRGTGQAYCIAYTNGMPTATVLPANVTVTVTASGTDINGTLLQAPPVGLPVT